MIQNIYFFFFLERISTDGTEFKFLFMCKCPTTWEGGVTKALGVRVLAF